MSEKKTSNSHLLEREPISKTLTGKFANRFALTKLKYKGLTGSILMNKISEKSKSS